MARPPRLETIFEQQKPLSYFITWSVRDRLKVLDNPSYWNALQTTIQAADRWEVECALVMPDHVHLLASPFIRDESLPDLVKFLKKRSRQLASGKWNWQEGFFDRLLRSSESAENKWAYIRENPVRARVVRRWQDWPYSYGFGEER